MTELENTANTHKWESEYDVVRLPLTWGSASILVFVAAYCYGDFVDHTRGWVRIYMEIAVVLSFGLTFGLIGRRRDKNKFPALIGNLLNGGILLMFVGIALIFLFEFLRPN